MGVFQCPYFSRFSLCIQKECEKENYQAVFLQASHITNQVLKDYTKPLAFMGACGIVVCGFEEQSLASDTRRELSECRLPIVFIERTADCYGFDRVLVDSEMGTQMAAKYLLEKGHRHLLYISQSGKCTSGRAAQSCQRLETGKLVPGKILLIFFIERGFGYGPQGAGRR